MSDWFEELLGFTERTPDGVREKLQLDGTRVRSKITSKSYECGRLEVVSLQELRERVAAAAVQSDGKLQVAELIGDARALHMDVANAGALFQVASQFNLLEMVSPSVTPEHGIGIYENDPTQGPACAIACGAGTLYRNYFVELDGQLGQTAERQIDCLAGIGRALGNENNRLWEMRNGYALPTREGLEEINSRLHKMSEGELDEVRAKLKVGVHSDVQVTLNDCTHVVTQVYCSAMPVAYTRHSSELWRVFAQLILDAAYEATFCAAAINAPRTGNKSLYLTMLGGGAFGNQESWIIAAIRRSLDLFRNRDLNVRIVSFRRPNQSLRELIT
jgi:hypothetical protein